MLLNNLKKHRWQIDGFMEVGIMVVKEKTRQEIL